MRLEIIKKTTIFKIPISVISHKQLIRDILETIKSDQRKSYMYVNPHVINESLKNHTLQNSLQSNDLNFCDSIGCKLAAFFLRRTNIRRITPPNFFFHLIENAVQEQQRIFFLGSTDENLSALVKLLHSKYPRIKLLSHHGFFEDDYHIIDSINQFHPHLLFVCLGTPKQELWITSKLPQLNANAIISGGSLFERITKKEPRPNRFISFIGLEWLARLFSHPRKYWRRYVIGNTLFMLRIVTSLINRKY